MFHRLTAVRDLGRRKRKRVWLFRCECGEAVEVQSALVRRGYTKSCGCFRVSWARGRQTRHGQHRSPTYLSWQGMIERCRNPNVPAYDDYGGRGIRVCDRWSGSFETFLADMGERPAGTTLDRRDVNGHYEPSNCRWATPHVQATNRRNTIRVELDGELMLFGDACALVGVPYATAYSRIRRGKTPLQALGLPVAPDGQNT
ncbi:hypothetical protein [Methylobacterium fujisawaense]|uniref:hypothetical protein n=1 Tax=Methylobacterium fujisawaense TaxID=107400 RepID=UPI0037012C25